MLEGVLAFDIETSSFDKQGRPIRIKDFDNYVKHAEVKWFGAYSYKYKKYFLFNAVTQRNDIMKLISQHDTFVGVNSESFDMPIVQNNQLINHKYFKQIDLQICLGNNTHQGHKRRAEYMGVELRPVIIDGVEHGENSMISLAHHFDIPLLKGDIDYKIFYKKEWTKEEEKEIKSYLRKDVEITKFLFEKMFDFWIIFTEWLYEENVRDWSWIKKSIASLTYLSACQVLGIKPTYDDAKDEKEEMGGRAIDPVQDEIYNVHYMDEASKYPHTFAEFNLFNEVDVSGISQQEIDEKIRRGELWHGNEKFKVRGYYDVRKQGILEKEIIIKLNTRFAIKKVLKNIKDDKLQIPIPLELKDTIKSNIITKKDIKFLEGLQYAIKIFLNSLYGAARSTIFKEIYFTNCVWDCCWIGQQIHEYVQKHFEKYGYRIVGGFTDSWFFEAKEGDTKEKILSIAKEIMDELKRYMPFPADSHTIEYERKMDYLLYHYDESKKRYLKNNYAFVSGDKVKVVGFPIMKNNSTLLSMRIFDKYIKPYGLENKRLKLDYDTIKKYIKEELTNDLTLASITWKVQPFKSYKNSGQIQAQISKNYLDGDGGRVRLIKNGRVGKVGKDDKYCDVEEAKQQNLRFEEIALEKVWNELEPFIIKKKQPSLSSFVEETKQTNSGMSDDELFKQCVNKPIPIKEKKWF